MLNPRPTRVLSSPAFRAFGTLEAEFPLTRHRLTGVEIQRNTLLAGLHLVHYDAAFLG
jgi:hypothetical protein